MNLKEGDLVLILKPDIYGRTQLIGRIVRIFRMNTSNNDLFYTEAEYIHCFNSEEGCCELVNMNSLTRLEKIIYGVEHE